MGCKHKYSKTIIDDPKIVNEMNNSINDMTGKCPAVKRRGCKK